MRTLRSVLLQLLEPPLLLLPPELRVLLLLPLAAAALPLLLKVAHLRPLPKLVFPVPMVLVFLALKGWWLPPPPFRCCCC